MEGYVCPSQKSALVVCVLVLVKMPLVIAPAVLRLHWHLFQIRHWGRELHGDGDHGIPAVTAVMGTEFTVVPWGWGTNLRYFRGMGTVATVVPAVLQMQVFFTGWAQPWRKTFATVGTFSWWIAVSSWTEMICLTLNDFAYFAVCKTTKRTSETLFVWCSAE